MQLPVTNCGSRKQERRKVRFEEECDGTQRATDRQLCGWCQADIADLCELPVLTDSLPMTGGLLDHCSGNMYCSNECIVSKAIAFAGPAYEHALRMRFKAAHPNLAWDFPLVIEGSRTGQIYNRGVCDDGQMTDATIEIVLHDPKRALVAEDEDN